MRSHESHVSEQELVMAADGELSGHRAVRVKAHLNQCSICRSRISYIKDAMAGFSGAQMEALNSKLPPIANPRALLRARLAERIESQADHWRWLRLSRAGAIVLGMVCIGLAGNLALRRMIPMRDEARSATFDPGSVPNPALTPGAARDVTLANVCSMPHEQVVSDVSASLRKEVLREYGIADSRAADYQIDYLIAPGLGGTDNIHNLWPEPYRSHWNAHVKDALEERLHHLVCAHQLDLNTARQEIASNWIGAYRKYFRSD